MTASPPSSFYGSCFIVSWDLVLYRGLRPVGYFFFHWKYHFPCLYTCKFSLSFIISAPLLFLPSEFLQSFSGLLQLLLTENQICCRGQSFVVENRTRSSQVKAGDTYSRLLTCYRMIERLVVAGRTFRTTPEATSRICLSEATAHLNEGNAAPVLVTKAARPGNCCHPCWSHGARDWLDIRASVLAAASVPECPTTVVSRSQSWSSLSLPLSNLIQMHLFGGDTAHAELSAKAPESCRLPFSSLWCTRSHASMGLESYRVSQFSRSATLI